MFVIVFKNSKCFIPSCMLFQREHTLVHRRVRCRNDTTLLVHLSNQQDDVLILRKDAILYVFGCIEDSYSISITVLRTLSFTGGRSRGLSPPSTPFCTSIWSGKLLKKGARRGVVAIDCSQSIRVVHVVLLHDSWKCYTMKTRMRSSRGIASKR